MTFQSPSHAWATWLNRPEDLILIAENAAIVRSALDALANGNLSMARSLWESVDGDQLLAAWDAQVVAIRDKSLWPTILLSKEKNQPRTVKGLDRSLSTRVFERDEYKCGYCGISVVTQWKNGDIPQLVTAFPDVTKWLTVVDGSLNGNGKSGALTNRDVAKWLWITAVADHVHPASDGGPTEMNNLITSCGGCNYGKEDWTLEQLNVRPPIIL